MENKKVKKWLDNKPQLKGRFTVTIRVDRGADTRTLMAVLRALKGGA